ncbi:MAG: hypothetical protein K2W96_02860 [Gemmataceae bacterium]|nr:hypothetical protein [Gemmataceae bacterium]
MSAPPPSRLRAWLVQGVLPLAAGAGLLALVLWLGWQARAWLRGPEEEKPPAATGWAWRDLDCDWPPGLTRLEFLDEAHYLKAFPAEPEEAGVRASLLAHPWVREVRKVDLGAKPRAEVYFRVPVLRVSPWDRAVDRDGVLLPRVPDMSRLFWTKAKLPRPGKPGQRCGDADVGVAASVAGFLLRHADKMGLEGAEVKVEAGVATVKGTVWGHAPGAEEAGEAKAAAKLERMLKGERGDLRKP